MGRKGLVTVVVTGLICAVAILAAWGWRAVAPYPQVGSVYLAEQVCACVFVAGRDEPSCRAEFEPDIKKFTVAVDRTGAPDRGAVTAKLAFFKGAARFERGYGCTITR